MKSTLPTGRFRKDVQRLEKRGMDLSKLEDILTLLQAGAPLPARAFPHKLTGKWYGFWECHIGPNWLLIYEITDAAIVLSRTGSHTDLFE